MMMLLFRSTAGLVGGGAFQQPVQLAGNSALAAAADLALALALGDAAAGVDPGRPVMDLARITMVCKARFSCRSPPRLRRWRTTWPEDASTGAAPASIAKAASEQNRPGWDQLLSS